MSRDARVGRSTTGAAQRGSAMRVVVVGLVWSLVVASPAMAVDITVTTTVDELLTDPDNSNCTLREAIEAVRTELQVDACPPGVSGLDRILLTSLTGTIFLLDELQIPNRSLDIIGPGARQLTISGQNNVRVFHVLPPATSLRTVSDITIANGRGADGGGILTNGRLTIKNTSFIGNFAEEDGGAISNARQPMQEPAPVLTVLNSTFSENGVIDAPGHQEEGGAIVNIDGSVTIANSTFVGHNVPNTGGAIHNSGNNDGTGDLTLINSTISSNSAAAGGAGVFTERGGTVTLRNTLIAGNTGTNCGLADIGSQIIDGGGNLDDGTSCAFSETTSLSNATAGLAAGLQNNGGPTDTIALTTNPPSDAIDFGLNAFCADAGTVNNLDQRGAPFIRPTDGDGDGNAFCDIGAFESDAASPQSNLPLVVTNPGNQASAVGAIVNLPISASDPNGNTLSYSATGLPAGLSINAATGVVTGTLSTAGTSNVTVTVSDSQGGTASTGFIWTVTSTATGPAPQCSGRTANIFVRDGFIVGGPDAGRQYGGRLRGTASADVMVGTPGNDTLAGSRGNDRICGGGGKDSIKGGAGNDSLFGQAGKDKLSGGSGSDRCNGGRGRDTITACERILNR